MRFKAQQIAVAKTYCSEKSLAMRFRNYGGWLRMMDRRKRPAGALTLDGPLATSNRSAKIVSV